ncbi:MAG: precorrin-6A/cobalt-precorrin-6A reductase, partial [Clostridia bacterium]|nr:precorrin-6A/cobalt-precorrin-6A reductase [Clostridia bacterium]
MRILLFGGTTEGRKEALRLHRAGEDVTVCVTSDYAAQLLPEGIRVLTGAMDGDEMRRLMARLAPELVVDATHPYALRATENIRAAAGALGIPLRRIARP